MRKEHRTRVVQKDWRVQRPRTRHETQRVRVPKVTRAWTRKEVKFDPTHLPRVWMGVYRRAGAEPVVTTTAKSVAQRRLKEGDPVGVKVDRGAPEARRWREHRVTRGRPQSRSFRGRDRRSVDTQGQRTVTWKQPGVRPARLPYYDKLYKVLQGTGNGETEARTFARGGATRGRPRGTAEGRTRWAGLRLPRRARPR